MTLREMATRAISEARQRIDSHLGGNRDPLLSTEYDDLLCRFKAMLGEMATELESECPSPRPPTMAHIVADSWLYKSELATLITKAESTFNKCAERCQRRA